MRTLFLLCLITLGLRTLPFQLLRRLLASMAWPPSTGRTSTLIAPDRIAWIVEAASRYVPGGRTCLSQALATQVLLAREGQPARLCIGVTRSGERQLQAHAWVESQGRVVVGSVGDASRYTPLAALKCRTPRS